MGERRLGPSTANAEAFEDTRQRGERGAADAKMTPATALEQIDSLSHAAMAEGAATMSDSIPEEMSIKLTSKH